MKLSVRRIVLLILSIFVFGFGLYNIVSVVLELPAAREEVLGMLSDQQISEYIPDPEQIVNVAVGIAVVMGCISSAILFAPAVLGLLASLGKYKGGVHIVFAWIYLVFACIGLIVSIVGFIKAEQFDWISLVSILEVGVIISFIIFSRQIKDGED